MRKTSRSAAPRPRADKTWPVPDGRAPRFIESGRSLRVLDKDGLEIVVPMSKVDLDRIAPSRAAVRGPLALHAVALGTEAVLAEIDMHRIGSEATAPPIPRWKITELVKLAALLRHLRVAATWIDGEFPGPSLRGLSAPAARVDAGVLGIKASAHHAVLQVLQVVEGVVTGGMHDGDLLRVDEGFDEAIERLRLERSGADDIAGVVARAAQVAPWYSVDAEAMLRPSKLCASLWRGGIRDLLVVEAAGVVAATSSETRISIEQWIAGDPSLGVWPAAKRTVQWRVRHYAQVLGLDGPEWSRLGPRFRRPLLSGVLQVQRKPAGK